MRAVAEMTHVRQAAVVVAASGVLASVLAPFGARRAAAYEFDIDALTVGQGYQLRWFRDGEDELLNRRRITQALGLRVWDILEPAPDPGYPNRPRERAPFELSFDMSLRLDHDFGGFTGGDVIDPDDSAVSVVPELERSYYGLDLLHASLSGRGVGGFLDFELGRLLHVDTLEWTSFDGAIVRARLPAHVLVEASGGLVVRESGWLGSGTHEPDGTQAAECVAWDDAAATFIDAGGCRQRETLMPTVGLAAETHGLRDLQARLSYRRSMSPEGESLPGDDRGLAVNEEKLAGTVRARFLDGGIVPWVAARWNVLLSTVDEAHAGVRVAWPTFAVTPEILWSLPTFDGDSIWNVFSVEPYTEGRASVDWWPGRGALRTTARAFARRWESEDWSGKTEVETTPSGEMDPLDITGEVPRHRWSAGATAGARLASRRGRIRADVFYEDGYGGLRAGGDLSGRMRLTRDLDVEGRFTAIVFDEDSLPELDGVSGGLQAGATWRFAEGMAFHLLLEENVNRFNPHQLRVIGMLDLAFRPEP